MIKVEKEGGIYNAHIMDYNTGEYSALDVSGLETYPGWNDSDAFREFLAGVIGAHFPCSDRKENERLAARMMDVADHGVACVIQAIGDKTE